MASDSTPLPCGAPEHRQFDFWIGRWEVVLAGSGQVLGRNRIEAVHGGCTLLESWEGTTGHRGNSLSWWEPQEALWRQLWRDSSGLTLNLSGGFADGRMRMFAVTLEAAAAPLYHRITWNPLPSGGLRHLWETSRNWGETWTADYDLLYRHV